MTKTLDCAVCQALSPDQLTAIAGFSQTAAYDWLRDAGYEFVRTVVRAHANHSVAVDDIVLLPFVEEPTVMTGIDHEVERAVETQADWFRNQDIQLPPGFVAGTIKSGDHWLRVKLVEAEGEEVEIRQAAPVDVRIHIAAKLPSRKVTNRECVFVFGDCQIGWFFDPELEVWRPTHDPSAMDIAIQLAADLEAEHGVQHVVNLGDHLDLPSLSKHDSAAAVMAFGSLNRSLDTAAQFDAALAAVTPNADHVFVGGNHDARFTRYLTGTKSPLIGIRRASLAEEVTGLQRPVLTVEFLTRQSETGWRSCGEWPAAEHRIGSNVFKHGDCVRPTNTATGDRYLSQSPTVSTHYGHIHRAGYTERLVEVDGIWRVLVAGSPGALCRTDGPVPGSRTALLPNGTPARRKEAWSQGVAVLWIDPTDLNATPGVEHIRILNGQAIWRGRLYQARVDVEGNPLGRRAPGAQWRRL